MKRVAKKLAEMVICSNVNSACIAINYQPKLPAKAVEKFKK